MDIPRLIIDLAMMLMTAAVVTIIFRKLRIPSILGYILAGFLIGPHFQYFLEVESAPSIETWSEIGVVIILFHIGLEFDFNKLSEIGSTAIVSAAVKMGGVMAVGYGFGLMLGMTHMDCIFLGAMLSISSTVVIQKCFSEMGLEGEKYTKLVMGSLVMEDVFSVFMMVALTAVSASKNVGGAGMALHMCLMITYLILWLIVGIFLVPTFLDRAMNFMNDETLTLLSIGFCFLMALLAKRLGFSMELGAFVAGSLFAGTRHYHDIERVTTGIKDMFGAIFFLSVGMLVEPSIIATRWTSIVPIAVIAVIAKLIFATIGMMLSGQDLDTSLRGGISLAPIGEFSFIIAGLGTSLGVMDSYLYPVIVSASILTIMVTPVLIRHQDRIVGGIGSVIPARIMERIDDYTSDDQSAEEHTSEWMIVMKDYFIKMLVYGSIMLVTALAGNNVLFPLIEEGAGSLAAKIIVTFIVYAVMLVFAMPFMGKRNAAFTKLWTERLSNRPPLMVMTLLKVVILVGIGLIPLIHVLDIRNPLILLLIPLSVILVARSEFISTYYLQLEARFLANLNQKTMAERGGERDEQNWLDEDYNIASWIVPEGASYAGKTLEALAWGKRYSVYAVKVRRGEKRMVMPHARTVIQEGDKVYVIGERPPLETFCRMLETNTNGIQTIREFFNSGYSRENALECACIKMRGTEPYVGKPIKKSGITAKNHCMILGIERDGYAVKMPDANMLIEKGDILWIIGTNNNLETIAVHSVGMEGIHTEEQSAGHEMITKESGEEE